MLRLRTLGCLDLGGVEDEAALREALQPKRIALLTFLALDAHGGFHRRDSLVALLWPELDQAHARAALRKALHHLRALAPDLIVARGDEEVRVDPTALWCDASELNRLAADFPDAALALYQGELLSGLHVPDAPEFERWLDRMRERLRAAATACALQLVAQSRTSNQSADAIRWAGRAVDLAPLEEHANHTLIEVLEAAGDRPGALSAYERYARRLAAELETVPGHATQRLGARLRESHGLVPELEQAQPPSDTDDLDKIRLPERPVSHSRRSWSLRMALAAGGLLAAGATWGYFGRESVLDPTLVVVAPFENRTGDASLDRLGLELAERVTLALARSGAGKPVPAARLRELVGAATAGSPNLSRRVASRSGAGLLISGSYGGRTDALEVLAELLRMPAGSQVSLIEPVTGTESFALGDTVGERLSVAVNATADWGDRFGWGTQHRLPLSLAAYRAAVEGDAGGRSAADAYRRALAADAAWPYARIHVARMAGTDSAFETLRSSASTWLPGDRDALEFWLRWQAQDYEGALQVARGRLTVDSANWLNFAVNAAFWTNRLEEVVRLAARRNEQKYFSQAGRTAGLAHSVEYCLVHALHGLDRDTEALEVAREYRRKYAANVLSGITVEFTARAGLGQTAEVEKLVAQAEGIRPDSQPASAFYTNASRATIAALELQAHGHPEAAKRVARRAVDWLEQANARSPDDPVLLRGLVNALKVAEEWDRILIMGKRLEMLLPRGSHTFYALVYQAEALAAKGQTSAAREAVRRARCCNVGLRPGEASLFLTMPLARLGDSVGAMEEFRSSWQAGYWEARSHAQRHRAVGPFLKNYAPFAELTKLRN